MNNMLATLLEDYMSSLGITDVLADVIRAEMGLAFFDNDVEAMAMVEAPAAKSHHQNYPGGLLEHSLKLCKFLFSRTIEGGARPENAIVLTVRQVAQVGLFHDLCKLHLYQKQADGTYAYDRNLLGHHAKLSVQIAHNLIGHLDPQVEICILLHMAGGFWNNEDYEELNDPMLIWAIRNLRTVSAVQWADMKACE